MQPQSVRLLLVDDEPPLLRLMHQYLTRLGYYVHACADAKSATDAFDAEAGAFHILVTDLTLAGMGGDELALLLMTRNPRLAVLLCSGYPFDVTSMPTDMRNRVAALQKPFAPSVLAENIKDLLKRLPEPV